MCLTVRRVVSISFLLLWLLGPSCRGAQLPRPADPQNSAARRHGSDLENSVAARQRCTKGGGCSSPVTDDCCGNNVCEGAESPGNCTEDCGFGACDGTHCSDKCPCNIPYVCTMSTCVLPGSGIHRTGCVQNVLDCTRPPLCSSQCDSCSSSQNDSSCVGNVGGPHACYSGC
jgi:hypothetical protein